MQGCCQLTPTPLRELQVLAQGKQHAFQASLRTSARLNVLSPAIFPLPSGAKVPPLQLSHTEAEQADDKGISASPVEHTRLQQVSAGLKSAPSAQQAQHAQQVPIQDHEPDCKASTLNNGQSAGSSSPPSVKSAVIAEAAKLHASTATSHSGPKAAKPALKGGNQRQSKKAGKPSEQGGKVLTVGPVTRLQGSASGLAASKDDDQELKSSMQSLGKTLLPLFDSPRFEPCQRVRNNALVAKRLDPRWQLHDALKYFMSLSSTWIGQS